MNLSSLSSFTVLSRIPTSLGGLFTLLTWKTISAYTNDPKPSVTVMFT